MNAARADSPIATSGWRAAAFGSTWIAYATYYFGRKGYSVTKTSISAELGANVLVGVETAYLAAYALGQYTNGYLGDRIGARRLIVLGLVASAAATLAFSNGTATTLFLVTYLINGLAQAAGWPGTIKAMAEWTTPENRGRVMGFWATCYQVGGLAATAYATALMARYGWRGSFVGCALAMIGVAVLVALLLRPGPGLAAERARAAAAAPGEAHASVEAEANRVARRRVLRSPLLWCYGSAYFFMKLIRYSILFWLPTYLELSLGYTKVEAGYSSTSFEIGGVVGTIAIGFLSDRYRRFSRATWAAASMFLLAGSFYLYGQTSHLGHAVSFLGMALVGFLLFGPDALVSGAAAQDAGGPRAAAVAAGFINGTGSIGGVLQEAVTRGISGRFGWTSLFHAFVVFSVISGLVLVVAARLKPEEQPTS